MRLRQGVAMFLMLQACGSHAGAADTACAEMRPLPLVVDIAGAGQRHALLTGGADAGLRLVDAADGAELWSASSGAGSTETFEQMASPFGGSLTAIDLDGDGVHDRLYAGDRSGQLWRFDFDSGQPASRWATGGVLATLGGPGIARGFIAAPDVTLMVRGDVTWINIAIGTATIGEGRVDNRFYVLRDRQPFQRIDAAGFSALVPLREADLEIVIAPLAVRDLAGPGYYFALGSSQVLAPSLTLDGMIHFTVAETSRQLANSCPVDAIASELSILSVSVIRAEDAAVVQDVNDDGRTDHGDLRVSLPRSLPSNAGVQLSASGTDAAGALGCFVEDIVLEGCQLDTLPRRTYWRREDAE